jgi:hypothetical protein
MTPGITLITPTGGRPESFARCVSFVQRFEKPEGVPIQWIIVDDCVSTARSLSVPGMWCMTIVPHPQWVSGMNSLGRNLLYAIPYVEHECILFIEDDDFYAPEYLKSMYEGLQTANIVGEVPARYYHVPFRQYNVQGNFSHASLCQTGIRSSLLSKLEDICRAQDHEFIDVRLWRNQPTPLFLHTSFCIGMKGLPGRAGIGIGHRPDWNPQSWKHDPDLSILRNWMGTDTKLYFKEPNLERLQVRGSVVRR